MRNEYTAELLDLIWADLCDNEIYARVTYLLNQRYTELFRAAIIEDWKDAWGDDIHGFDIVKLSETPADAEQILGCFDDEIYDLFEECLRWETA